MVVVSLLVDTPWVWGITMERTPVSLGLGSRPRLISKRRVRSEGLQNLTLSKVTVPCPGLAHCIPFGPVTTLLSFFHFIYF